MNINMIRTGLLCVAVATLSCLMSAEVFAQASAKIASATPVNKSSGKSSTVSIRQNQLNIFKANIERQLRKAQRCVQVSRLPVLLRDPQGNVNQVPKIDIVFCSRQVQVLSRELAAINRQLADLPKDSQSAAGYLSDQAAQAALFKRLQTSDSLSSQ